MSTKSILKRWMKEGRGKEEEEKERKRKRKSKQLRMKMPCGHACSIIKEYCRRSCRMFTWIWMKETAVLNMMK